MTDSDRTRLLHGPYTPPRLKLGKRTSCLLRDCDVLVTGWSDAPLPWPLCRPVVFHGGKSALLVDQELLRAIRCESAVALKHWWGVSRKGVTKWRKRFGVGRKDCAGSRRLLRSASALGTERLRVQGVCPAVCALRRQIAVAKNFAARLQARPLGRRWTAQEVALLGTASDQDSAARLGRPLDAVRLQRQRRDIPPLSGPEEPRRDAPPGGGQDAEAGGGNRVGRRRSPRTGSTQSSPRAPPARSLTGARTSSPMPPRSSTGKRSTTERSGRYPR
jgi:hypothetical protein